MPKLFVQLILALVITVAGLALTNATLSQYLIAFIALAALTVSVVSAFKDDVFPFRPRAFIDEIVFAIPSAPPLDNPILILPIVFFNDGYGSGVIEGLTLVIENQENTKIYIPVFEVDYQKFFSGKVALHGENILGTFSQFCLGSRESEKKHIAFSQAEKSQRSPYPPWSAGKYKFRLYMKHTSTQVPIEVATITQDVSTNVLTDYKNGMGTSLSFNRELHVNL